MIIPNLSFVRKIDISVRETVLSGGF